jgi:hypothetical protein
MQWAGHEHERHGQSEEHFLQRRGVRDEIQRDPTETAMTRVTPLVDTWGE